MILAAALTLSFLAILGLIQLAHLFLFWLTPPASPRAADNIVDIQHGSCPGAWCKSVALYAAPGG